MYPRPAGGRERESSSARARTRLRSAPRRVEHGALLVLLLAACGGSPSEAVDEGPPDGFSLRVETLASGLESPVYLTAPTGDPRLFVVEQPGRIRVIRQGQLLARPFLDITAKVLAGGERGLLGLAFHPDYAQNGLFFVYYTDRAGDTRVERYRVSSDADAADAFTAHPILAIDQPYANHNGGLLIFGPDGRLYVGLGDGGSGGDPQRNGQNPGTLLGSILRLDVDAGDPYAIPPDNPFVGRATDRPEIWAWGLRNPWRFSFDRVGRLLYIGDVGQNAWEEINVAPAGQGGLNYGWNVMEGRHCFGSISCSTDGLTLPALEYGHDQGCSVTGGLVYRGQSMPELDGHYFYSDYCAGWLRSFRYSGGQVTQPRDWGLDVGRVLSFGEGADGEIYLLVATGLVYRLVRDS